MRMTLRIRQNHSDPTHAVPTALILKEPDGKTLKYQFGTLRIYRNKDLIQVQADEITVNPQVAETLDYIRTRAEEAQIQNMQTEKHDHTQYYLESAAIHEMEYAPNTTKTRITQTDARHRNPCQPKTHSHNCERSHSCQHYRATITQHP